ncbi:flagellar hook-basal body protein [Gracilibacillus sp. YIM 98692]|uniref:flagellar hook-basal body protein n=1 Tax=Gracilibacillus sp. YIM 98692 TaxID=2663532 RepID=UPI0013D5A61E|nr:flagellar hook-basal body protein [Gracilibacillus sp. YIM 98692]
MTRMTWQAAATMSQLQNKLDTISNNIANSSTTGYKTREGNFSSLLVQQLEQVDDPEAQDPRQTPEGIRLGSGAMLGHTNVNLKQGSIQTTERPLDVALLEPNQLFEVGVFENGVEETRYTRAGNFYWSPMDDGQVMLVTSDGNPVLGEDGPILLDDQMDDLEISESGQINVTRNGQQAVEGQINVVEAVRPRLLEAAGDSLFRLSDETLNTYGVDEVIGAVEDIQLKSGALETSNVDLGKQMTAMLESQRAYQFNARTISMHDQMKGLINQFR